MRRNSGDNEEESSNNALNQRIVLSSRTLKRPRIATTNQPNKNYQINMMGNMTDCDFYIPDVTGDTTGLSFRVTYGAANRHTNSNAKKLCTCVGSMLCSVVPEFRNSVEAALNAIGIRPRFVSLPSQARQNHIVVSEVEKYDWSSILVVFGYCILILFKIDSKLFDFYAADVGPSLHKGKVDELRKKVGCSPSKYLYGIPFDRQTEADIRTMLGNHALRDSVITFLMENFNHPDQQISSLCQYLSYVLSWSGDLRVFTLMNERLVKTNSPILSDSRVVAEVENLEELIKAIASHTYPQYFNHLCLTSELFYLDISRFPNLFAVAKVLEKGDVVTASLYYEIAGMNKNTVVELVKLHRAAMAQNRVSTVRCMPSVPGI